MAAAQKAMEAYVKLNGASFFGRCQTIIERSVGNVEWRRCWLYYCVWSALPFRKLIIKTGAGKHRLLSIEKMATTFLKNLGDEKALVVIKAAQILMLCARCNGRAKSGANACRFRLHTITVRMILQNWLPNSVTMYIALQTSMPDFGVGDYEPIF
jgi:hypothetical protein